MPSPTSSGAQSPNLGSPVHDASRVGGAGAGVAAAAAAATGGIERRPTHTRNVSSLSSNMYQLPSPDIVLTPEDDLRRSQLLASGIERQRQLQQQEGEAPSASAAAARGSDEGKSLGALEGVAERKKTAGKKSSFGEMLDEGDGKAEASGTTK